MSRSWCLWYHARACAMVVALLGGGGPLARAQDSIPWPAANRLAVTVTARVQARKDTVIVSYGIANDPGSGQPAQGFAVRLTIAAYRLVAPMGWSGSRAVVQDSGAAYWFAWHKPALIQPGSALTGFVLEGQGLAAPAAYRVQGDYAPPVYNDSTGQPIQHPPSFWKNSVSGRTIGLTPLALDPSAGSRLALLRSILDDFCSEAASAGGLCNSLAVKLGAASRALTQGDNPEARGALGAFVRELQSGAATMKLGGDTASALRVDAELVLRRL
jgi:hypothetical protein